MAPWAVATQNSAQGAKLLRASVVLGRRQMGQTSLFRVDQKLGMTICFLIGLVAWPPGPWQHKTRPRGPSYFVPPSFLEEGKWGKPLCFVPIKN
ncbi:hypothetical protein LF1_24440 [Rubripirellula obstinata]|uniref:Uncharacterized protein n=1 Tax=Rubripirellula obstinata TaxID=406547 RepID=A0A5B1CFC7_9BACT|nr:hypothetical protein LF1_24440 [Rubripirellula obstinata]